MSKTSTEEDIKKAEAFFEKYHLFPLHGPNRSKAIAELAHTFFEERVKGRLDGVLELRTAMGTIANEALKHISDDSVELIINHNGRNMTILRDAPRKKKG
jgi:hypothetical protein